MSQKEKLAEEVESACKDFLIKFKRDITFAQMRALMVEIHDSCEECKHNGGKDCNKCKMVVVHGDTEFKIDGRTKKVEEVIDLDVPKKEDI